MSEYKELLKHFGIKSELMVADMIDEECELLNRVEQFLHSEVEK